GPAPASAPARDSASRSASGSPKRTAARSRCRAVRGGAPRLPWGCRAGRSTSGWHHSVIDVQVPGHRSSVSLRCQTSGGTMKAFRSVDYIPVHVGVVAAVLFGTAKSGRSDPVRPIEREIFFQPAAPVTGGDAGGLSLPSPITVAPLDLGTISVSMTLPKTGGPMPIFSPIHSGGVTSLGAGQP